MLAIISKDTTYMIAQIPKNMIILDFLPSLSSCLPKRRLITNMIITGRKTNDRYKNIWLLTTLLQYIKIGAGTQSVIVDQ